MADQVTNYKCSACGGPLKYVGVSGKLECEYCGSSYSVEEIEAAMQAQNNEAAANWTIASAEGSWGTDGMKLYSCPSCGAELICDGSTAATCCPYCGNQTVIPGQFSGSLKPEFIIPFKTSKEQAIAALKNHYKGKTLLPKSFVSGNHIDDIQGVYVPFWMFDCQAVGSAQYDAEEEMTRRVGNTEVTTTRYYNVLRSGVLGFDKVPVDASTRMPDGHMDSIEPYNYSELKPFSMAYMPGFLADKYDVEPGECSLRMEERCRETFMDEIDKTISNNYTRTTLRNKSVQIRKGPVHYAMLPVWLLATRWKDQNFLFAMNGQSGKLVGELPMDKGKYWGFLGGIGGILVGLMQLLNFLVLSTPLQGFGYAFLTIILPLLIALITVTVMKSNLSSVHKQRAANYITGMGLQLMDRRDIYVRTTTKTKVIEENNN